jgi:hypothetical protein
MDKVNFQHLFEHQQNDMYCFQSTDLFNKRPLSHAPVRCHPVVTQASRLSVSLWVIPFSCSNVGWSLVLHHLPTKCTQVVVYDFHQDAFSLSAYEIRTLRTQLEIDDAATIELLIHHTNDGVGKHVFACVEILLAQGLSAMVNLEQLVRDSYHRSATELIQHYSSTDLKAVRDRFSARNRALPPSGTVDYSQVEMDSDSWEEIWALVITPECAAKLAAKRAKDQADRHAG